MPITSTEVNAIATAEAAKYLYLSLHTGDPGSTGATEATGGSPAYARQSAGFTASAGTATSTQVTFNVPAGTYGYFGIWSASTSGTFYGGGALSPSSQTLSSQGQIKLTVTVPVTAS